MDLTPNFVGKSLVFVLIGYVLAFAFQIYMLYLNHKQSKVKDTTLELIALNQKQNKLLEQIYWELKKLK